MIYGYARVSTREQNAQPQIATLQAAGAHTVRVEKTTGTKLEGRQELALILDFIREGDTLLCTRIDRLARSVLDLQKIIATLREKGAVLRCTEQPIDMATPSGKAFLDMLGVFAEFETNLRAERQHEGIQAAKARGAYKGRARVVSDEGLREMIETGLSDAAIAEAVGCNRTTIFKRRKALTTLPK